MAQVPSYVPTNGLVGYWPFNGNANDESGNGNNGGFTASSCDVCGNSIVTAPPLISSDRFNNINNSYIFSDQLDLISIGNNTNLQLTSQYTISLWLYPTSYDFGNYTWGVILAKWGGVGSASYQLRFSNSGNILFDTHNGINTTTISSTNDLPLNDWSNVIITQNNSIVNIIVNGVITTINPNMIIPMQVNNTIEIGRNYNQFSNYQYEGFLGKIDDICIWNRVLSSTEINNLSQSCSNDLLISPQSSNLSIGDNIIFSATTASSNPTYTWQSNPSNFGWQNVPVNSIYSGGTTNTLIVNNVQLANHNQPFRVIATSGTCTDTSNIATIQIADTCITNVTLYDTLLTTVTDTLIINTTLSLPSPNNENTILIYPNPASDHITIDNGNYTSMAGYTIKIENNAGQQVFQSLINQAQFYVDLSTWSGNGLYFVHLIDAQGNTVTVRKIVLQ